MTISARKELKLEGVEQLKVGDKVATIRLKAIDGSVFTSESYQGRRYMISFFRYASCPFCNLRLHLLTTRQHELENNFSIIAIFDSPLANLQKHTQDHRAPFPILADDTGMYYRQFGIRYSWFGVLKGIVMRLPLLMKGMFVHGYWPIIIKGKLHTMPADFLIDENGIVQRVFYGKDEGDHLSFDEIKQFSFGAVTQV